jgi:hypothetical protein
LGKTAAIDVNVSFLFGLAVTLKASFKSILEVIMKNSYAYVWIGVAVLGA